jgi:hypothetical protein
MRRSVVARLSAAVFSALLLLAGTAWLDKGGDPSRLERPTDASASVLALGSWVPRAAAVDRAEVLRDWARRDKRGPFGLAFLAPLLAALSCMLLAARQLIAIGAAGRTLQGIARSFAARSPPLLRPV